MTIDIHYDYDKLSINGVAKWCVGGRWVAVRAASESNLGMQKRDIHTYTHFIIIYISSAWQGKGKISKNVTYIQTLHHYIYIPIVITNFVAIITHLSRMELVHTWKLSILLSL